MEGGEKMDKAFEVHMLNEGGRKKAREIAEAFNLLLEVVTAMGADPRLLSITRTKLEEACFFAKKAMAMDKINQMDPP
jgi:hypothetical protein